MGGQHSFESFADSQEGHSGKIPYCRTVSVKTKKGNLCLDDNIGFCDHLVGLDIIELQRDGLTDVDRVAECISLFRGRVLGKLGKENRA